MTEIEIIPAIMPESFNDLNEKYSLVKEYVTMVQIDVMDGKFVSSKNWPYTAGEIKKIDFNFEVDLMVLNPENVIDDWIKAGAKRIIIHIESSEKIEEVFLKIPSGVEIGIAINTETENENIYPLIERINFVQFMGIEKIGFQGQSQDVRVLKKIADLRRKFSRVIISVDGGVNLESAPVLIQAGANRLVSGSAIFESNDIKRAIERLKNR